MDSITETSKAWFIKIVINKNNVNFKIDTGAAVTALPASYAEKLGVQLKETQCNLISAGNNKLAVIGAAEVMMTYNNIKVVEQIFLVDGLTVPLLGKPTISKLKIVNFIDEVVEDDKQKWVKQFPHLFEGLGSMKTEVNIQLKQGFKPYAQAVPRRVAAARRAPLQAELERMERRNRKN